MNAYKTNRQNKKTYDPVWAIRSTKGLPKATLNVQAEVGVSNEGKTIPLGRLTGSGILNGSGTWVVGTANTDFNISTLTINSPVEKRGSGKMTMGIGKMSGALTVGGGTVAFNNASLGTLLHGAFLTTVKDSGRVVGQGLLNAMALQKGGELTPCGSITNTTTPGTIKCNNNFTAAVGSVVNFLVGSTKNSMIEAKKITFNGTLKLIVLPERLLQVGDELKLWTVSDGFAGTPVLDLPAGIHFDDSRLATEGVLVVTDIDASISSVFADMDARNVYDLSGRLVRRQATEVSTEGLPRGIYIRAGRKVLVK